MCVPAGTDFTAGNYMSSCLHLLIDVGAGSCRRDVLPLSLILFSLVCEN